MADKKSSKRKAAAKAKLETKGRKKAEAAPKPPETESPPAPPAAAPQPQAQPKPKAKPRAAARPAAMARPRAEAPPQPQPQPEPEPAPKPTDTPSPSHTAELPMAALTPEQRETLEKLSINLAKAALTAQGAVAEAALRQAERPAALDPDPLKIAPALTEAMGRLANNPDKLMHAQAKLLDNYMELWRTTSQKLQGEQVQPVVEPQRGDRRFNDPDWQNNPVFDVMKQSYLLTANWLNELISGVEGMDPMEKRRIEFFTRMLTDAFSPSNFLLSNPVALREAMSSGGESLVKGAERFAADLERGGGQLAVSQTDTERFTVGVDVATAPGKVVFRNALFELLQFSPSTEEVYEIPLLILPPWINKYYILDLRPENSLIRWLADHGFTVFVASWVNPGPELAGKTLTDYMYDGAYTAIEAVLAQTGAKQTNIVGYCIAGTLLACTLAHMAAKKDERIAGATFFAAQQDFSEAGDLLIFTNDAWLSELEQKMDAAGGVLPGRMMADTFNALRANDLVWSFFVSNYLMGKEPAAFDLLFWNSDATRMPKALHMSYLRDFYKSNKLSEGTLELAGVKLDLGAVKTPVYVQAAKDDHIAPTRSVYKGAKLFGGPVTFTLAGSGHIAGVVNPPAAKKYQHWTNPALPPTVEEWQAGAVEHPGSWWPHWKVWLEERSGGKVPARDPAKGPLQPLGDAPGSYVQVKS